VFSSPQNTFAPDGYVADKQKNLFLLVMWPALAIMIGVFAVVIYTLIRYRYRQGEPPPQQVHGNTRLELGWTIAPAILLIAIAVPTLEGIFDLGRAPAADAMIVDVTGQQFAWAFSYADEEFQKADGSPLSIRTDLHVPVDREIGFNLHSEDVIHSFWVPKLAGKTDVVPGRTNRMWFRADEPGTYSAQCAEFCGDRHYAMRFTVIAQTQEDFDAWVQEQMAAPPEGGSPEPGGEPPDGSEPRPGEQPPE
jgi:cytochrome c oxidase subunit 2